MACFSCGENKSLTQIQMIELYKQAYLKTNISYWYFQKKGQSEILIMQSDDFTKFKSKNKKDFEAGKYEFANVMEFENTFNN